MLSTHAAHGDLLIGCTVETPGGSGFICNTTESYVAVVLKSGHLKRYARSHSHLLRAVRGLDPNDRIDRMFLRINAPGEKNCDLCGRAIRDRISIAIGIGPCCRKPEVKRRQASFDCDALLAGDRDLFEMMDDEALARDLVVPWWDPNA